MPILKWFASQGASKNFIVFKPVTTLGRALGNDIALEVDGVAEMHAQVLFDGRDFGLEELDKHAEILINGKKKRRTRLVHGDRIRLGEAEIQFSMFDEPATQRPRTASSPPISERQPFSVDQNLAGLRKLHGFSETLMTKKTIDELLEAMLDAVIEITGAEKGFVLLRDEQPQDSSSTEEGTTEAPKATIRASRQVNRESPSRNRSDIRQHRT